MYSDKEKIAAAIQYIEYQDTGLFVSDSFKKMKEIVTEGYIRPCPFCGGLDIEEISGADLDDYKNSHSFTMICNYNIGGCGATGGYRETEEEAIQAWNKRVD